MKNARWYVKVGFVFVLLFGLFAKNSFADPFAYVANYDSQDISVIDMADNHVASIIPTDQKYYNGMAVDYTNNKIYFGGNGSISVFDYMTDSFITSFPLAYSGSVETITVSKDGNRVYLPISRTYYPGQIERVEIANATTYSIEKVISLEDYCFGATQGQLSLDEARFYVSCRHSNNIVVIDTEKSEVMNIIPITTGIKPMGLALTRDGRKLYVISGYGDNVSVIDTDPTSPSYHQIIKSIPTGLSTGAGTIPTLSPDGARLYFTLYGNNALVVLDTQLDEVYSIIQTITPDPINVITSPDGKYIYVTSYNSNLVEVINAGTLTPMTTISVGGFGPWNIGLISKALQATIDIAPETLNLQSKGKYITCYIELPKGSNVNDISVESIKMNDVVSAETMPTQISDYDNDGIEDLMVKFDRAKVLNVLSGGTGSKEVTISGTLKSGQSIIGKDTIRLQ